MSLTTSSQITFLILISHPLKRLRVITVQLKVFPGKKITSYMIRENGKSAKDIHCKPVDIDQLVQLTS